MDSEQTEFYLGEADSLPAIPPVREALDSKPVRRLQPYRFRVSDQRIRWQVKQERGNCCERSDPEKLFVHYILEPWIFAECAREPLNTLVLCSRCYSRVTVGEGSSTSEQLLFYARLNPSIRRRHVGFLAAVPDISWALVSTFRDGSAESCEGRFVRDRLR